MSNENFDRSVIVERLEAIEASEDCALALADAIVDKDKWLSIDDPDAVVQELCSDSIASSISLLVHGVIAKLIAINGDENEFYDGLWRALSDEVLFVRRSERENAFAFALLDERLPYFRVETVRMDGDEFIDRVKILEESIEKLRRLSHRSFAQKTERGSAVLDLVLQYEDPRDRAVLMGIYLSF